MKLGRFFPFFSSFKYNSFSFVFFALILFFVVLFALVLFVVISQLLLRFCKGSGPGSGRVMISLNLVIQTEPSFPVFWLFAWKLEGKEEAQTGVGLELG